MAKLISNSSAAGWFFSTVAISQLLDWTRRVVMPTDPPEGLDGDWPYQWSFWPVALGFAAVIGLVAFLGSYVGNLAAGRHSQVQRHVAIISAITYAILLTVLLAAAPHFQLSSQQGLILVAAVVLVGPGAVSFYLKRVNGRDVADSRK